MSRPVAWPGFNNVVLCIYYMFSIHASAALKENSRSGSAWGGGSRLFAPGNEQNNWQQIALGQSIGPRLKRSSEERCCEYCGKYFSAQPWKLHQWNSKSYKLLFALSFPIKMFSWWNLLRLFHPIRERFGLLIWYKILCNNTLYTTVCNRDRKIKKCTEEWKIGIPALIY